MVLYNVVLSMYENMKEEAFEIAIAKLRRKIEKGLIPNATPDQLDVVLGQITNRNIVKDSEETEASKNIVDELQEIDIDNAIASLEEPEKEQEPDLSEEYLKFLEDDLLFEDEVYGDLKVYENNILRKFGGNR